MNEDHQNLKILLENSDFENGSGFQTSTGWVGDDEITNVYQLVFKNIDVKSEFSTKSKHLGYNSLEVDLKSMGPEKGSLVLLRMKLSIVEFENEDSYKKISQADLLNKIESLKFKLSFWSNTNYSKEIDVHKVYITKHIPDELDVPSIADLDFDLNTNGIWQKYEKEFEVTSKDITEDLFFYICLGYGEPNSKGIGNFDTIEFKITEVKQKDLPLPQSNLQLNSQNLLPIPHEIVVLFSDFLAARNVTSDQRESLDNDPAYPFAALLELWNREGLDFQDFINFVDQNHPDLDLSVSNFLRDNGIIVSAKINSEPEPTLRDIIEKEYGDKVSSLIIFYTKVILSTITDDPESLIDSPASESTAQLRALVQSFKEKTNNVDQLRTLDMLETVLDKYDPTPNASVSNVLTPHERLNALPSLTETNSVVNQTIDSASNAIMALVDGASANRIPKYEFRIGDEPLPARSQQKMDYLMSLIGGIDSKKDSTDYSKWLPGYFDVGGGIANNILGEATQRNYLEDVFTASIDGGLERFSTIDADLPLRRYVSSSLARDFADKSYTVKDRIFNTFGDFAGAFLSMFGDGREKDNYEKYFLKNAQKITNDALEHGYIDKSGVYHAPSPVSSETRAFASSAAATAGFEGFKDSFSTLNKTPYNLSRSVGINPMGDFYPNSLGSVYFPDSKKGVSNLPFSYNKSVPYRVGENLQSYLPSNTIKSIQRQVFERPDIYNSSRFDGSFAKTPEFKKAISGLGTSDFRYSQIKDGINKAYASNGFDRADNKIFARFSSAGNELIGNINKRLNVPFNGRYSTTSNLIPLAAAPFVAGARFLGKSGVPYFPGNNKFAEKLYGPQSLAARGVNLPNTYSPEVLRRLMQHEASFASPVVFTPSTEGRKPKYTKAQMDQYKRYRESLKNKTYGQRKPKLSPERIAFLKAQRAEEEARKRLRIVPVNVALAGGIIGTAMGSPVLVSGALSLAAVPAFAILDGIGILSGGKRGKDLPWWLPGPNWIESIGAYTGLSAISADIDEKTGKYIESGIKHAKLTNSIARRIPIFGKLFTVYNTNFDISLLQASFMQKALNATDPTRQKRFNESAEIAKGIHKIFGGELLNKLGTQADKSTGTKASSLNIFGQKFNNFRKGIGGISGGLLGLIDPIRRDQGMINSFFYFIDGTPKNLLKITGGVQRIYSKVLSKDMKDFIEKYTLGAPSKLGKFYNYLFSTSVVTKQGLLGRFYQTSVYNNHFLHLYFGATGRISTFMSFFRDPSRYFQTQLIKLFKYIMKEITTKITSAIFKPIVSGIYTAIRGAVASSLAAFGLTLGIGCLIVGLILVITLVSAGAFMNANNSAYGGNGLGQGGDGSAETVSNPYNGNGGTTTGLCPLETQLSCAQGPLGSFTHARMGTTPIDLSPVGAPAFPKQTFAYAVANGVIKYAGSSCKDPNLYAGNIISLVAEDGNTYEYFHIDYQKSEFIAKGLEGKTIKQGDAIGPLFNLPVVNGVRQSVDGCWDGMHLHIQAKNAAGKYYNAELLTINNWKCNLPKIGNSNLYCSDGDLQY